MNHNNRKTSLMCWSYCSTQAVWPLQTKWIPSRSECLLVLDSSASPSLVSDVSAVSPAQPCRLDLKQNFYSLLRSLHTLFWQTQGHWAVPVLPKGSCCQNRIFLHKAGLTERRHWTCPALGPWTEMVWILSCFWQIGLWQLEYIRPEQSRSHMNLKLLHESLSGGSRPHSLWPDDYKDEEKTGLGWWWKQTPHTSRISWSTNRKTRLK